MGRLHQLPVAEQRGGKRDQPDEGRQQHRQLRPEQARCDAENHHARR